MHMNSQQKPATWISQESSPRIHTRRNLPSSTTSTPPSTLWKPPLAPALSKLNHSPSKPPIMSITLSPSPLPLNSFPRFYTHAHLRLSLPPMSIIRRLNLRRQHSHRRRFATVAAAVWQDTTVWSPASLSDIQPAAESLFHVSIDVGDSPDLIASHTRPGQYLQLRLPDAAKPAFLAIASPPSFAAARGEFEFLVKSVVGSTAELLCGLKRGDSVELSQVMGKGFAIERIEPPENYSTVLIFATGSGISPIRSLIESGFGANKRSDVRLYYGARNLNTMAYQDRFEDWESSGVKIVPVLSQPDDSWRGETGYVQAAFARAKQTYSPQSAGVVLCGQKQMTEEVTSIVVGNGVPSEKILKNF